MEIVDQFFQSKFNEYERRLKHVIGRYPPNSNPADLDREELEDLTGVLLEVRGSLRNLQWYSDMNKRGFVKILKKFDKRMGTDTQNKYLASKVFVLPFGSGHLLHDKLGITNKYLSELSPYTDNKNNEISKTEQLLSNDDLSLKKVPSNGSTNSINSPQAVDIKSSLANDDVENFEIAIKKDASQRVLLNTLSKAVNLNAKGCLKVLIDNLDTLEDSTELHERTIIHRIIINQGRQMLEHGKDKGYINPAEPPRQPTKLHQNMETDGGSQSEDLFDIFKYLLGILKPSQRSALISKDQHARTPLHYSAHYGLKAMAREVLEHIKEWDLIKNYDLESDEWKDNEDETPIHLAVAHNHPKTCAVILEYSAKLDPNTPLLSVATMIGSAELINVLVDNNVDANTVIDGESALFVACKLNHVGAAQCLLERGADPEIAETVFGWTPVFVAAVDGYEEIVKLLNKYGCNIERVDESGWTAMEHACLRGHLDLADLLRPQVKVDSTKLLNNDSNFSINSDSTTNSGRHTPATIKSGKNININGSGSNTNGSSSPSRTQSPTTNNNNNESALDTIKTFGHRYLQNKAMVLVTLGSTDRREDGKVLDLARVPYSKAHSTQLDTALSLVVSGEKCEGDPFIYDLPLSDGQPTEPIAFYVNPEDLDDVRLYFDLVPTYSGRKKLGRAVALLKNIYTPLGKQKRSLHQTLTAPIIECETLDVLGHIKFGFLIVTPFEHAQMGIEKSSTYWKSLITTRVIGHRGLGKNSTSKKSLQLGENTLESFIQAANLGASYVEFDVQLTKDHVPVLYHDFLVAETGIDIPVHALTLEQFINVSEFSKQKMMNNGSTYTDKNKNARHGGGAKFEFSSSEAQQEKKSNSQLHRSRSVSVYQFDEDDEYEEMQKRMQYTRDFKNKGFKGNFRGHSIQSPFTTLAEVFKSAPKQVGFNIECKYPMLDESEAEDMESLAIELNAWVDTVLKTVFDNADGRDIIFSSFNPDICLMLSVKQPSFPVLFLSEGGTEYMADVRASSLQEGIRFAKRWDLLGVVSAARPLIQCPRLVNVVKESGLVCVTYGTDNNEPENARLQMQSGVDAVIVDSVLAIRKELTEGV